MMSQVLVPPNVFRITAHHQGNRNINNVQINKGLTSLEKVTWVVTQRASGRAGWRHLRVYGRSRRFYSVLLLLVCCYLIVSVSFIVIKLVLKLLHHERLILYPMRRNGLEWAYCAAEDRYWIGRSMYCEHQWLHACKRGERSEAQFKGKQSACLDYTHVQIVCMGGKRPLHTCLLEIGSISRLLMLYFTIGWSFEDLFHSSLIVYWTLWDFLRHLYFYTQLFLWIVLWNIFRNFFITYRSSTITLIITLFHLLHWFCDCIIYIIFLRTLFMHSLFRVIHWRSFVYRLAFTVLHWGLILLRHFCIRFYHIEHYPQWWTSLLSQSVTLWLALLCRGYVIWSLLGGTLYPLGTWI